VRRRRSGTTKSTKGTKGVKKKKRRNGEEHKGTEEEAGTAKRTKGVEGACLAAGGTAAKRQARRRIRPVSREDHEGTIEKKKKKRNPFIRGTVGTR